MKEIFTGIFKNNSWKSDESVSGQGSTRAQTELIRQELPRLFAKFHVKTLLDIPCGDCNWINAVEFSPDFEYYGADIVEAVVELARDNMRGKYGWNQNNFVVLDITKDVLPRTDMILVRDLLGHFSDSDLKLALDNIKRSGAKYLLATTFPNSFNTVGIKTGQWRALNLDYYCGLPPSIEIINEGNHVFKDKCLGLWQLR